jgi:hypothetical protein
MIVKGMGQPQAARFRPTSGSKTRLRGDAHESTPLDLTEDVFLNAHWTNNIKNAATSNIPVTRRYRFCFVAPFSKYANAN